MNHRFTTALLFTLLSSFLYAQTYTGSFDLVASQENKSGIKRVDTVSYYFGEDRTAIFIHTRPSEPDMRMIFDPSKSTITSLFEVNGRKSGFILPMDEEHWPGMPQAMRPHSDKNGGELNYSGKAKTIEGYECREVLAENSEYEAVLWLADEIPLSMTRVLSYQSVGKGKSKKEIELFNEMGLTALPLEMFLKSKTGKADVTIQLKNISESVGEAIWNTEGHELMEME